jgi:hypothetical protein
VPCISEILKVHTIESGVGILDGIEIVVVSLALDSCPLYTESTN